MARVSDKALGEDLLSNHCKQEMEPVSNFMGIVLEVVAGNFYSFHWCAIDAHETLVRRFSLSPAKRPCFNKQWGQSLPHTVEEMEATPFR